MKQHRCKHLSMAASTNDRLRSSANSRWVSTKGKLQFLIFIFVCIFYILESGILADMSMSPDTDLHQLDPQMWPTCIKKTNTSSSLSTTSSNTSSSTSSSKSTNRTTIADNNRLLSTNNEQQNHHRLHHHRHNHIHAATVTDSVNSVSSADQYLNNDSVTVHL